ncbi:hypothetical protein F5B17DRAFT_441580 [Nemania serpens]|nr:hypothetical protein F5B17DRAFT_441580 [Nemania serpens]
MTGDDCARQRFIVWAAVKRNRSVNMAASERLRCPLLRCGECFNGHEEMLRHLVRCQHLSTGEYICYECMKVERFNDKNCMCCLGHPTKKRRIINMAKHFFASIGTTKVRRDDHTPPIRSGPPSYNSLMVDMHEQDNQAQMQEPPRREESDRDSEQSKAGETHPELNGTELLELDSTPLLPTAELDTVNHNAHLTTILGPSGSYTEIREALMSPAPTFISRPQQSRGLPSTLQSNTGTSSSVGRRPSLVLNTQIDHHRTRPSATYLSPSSSLRSSSCGISPITPWSASSKSSTIWSAARDRDTVSASPITPLSANANLTALQEERAFGIEKDTDMRGCSKDPCHHALGDTPEPHEDGQRPSALIRFLSDPLMFSYDPEDSYSWLSSMKPEIPLSTSVNMMFTDPNAKAPIPPAFPDSQITASETKKTLVGQVWDALGEHLSNSVSKLDRLQNNPLADRLRAQTPRMVASAGLTRLRQALTYIYADQPDPLEYLCFVHLMYSVSLVLHEDGLVNRSNKLYEQAMAYGLLFDATYRDNYYQIVTSIWKPNSQESTARGRFGDSANRPTGNKGKEPDYHTSQVAVANFDPLVTAGQYFLDELERIMVNGNVQQPTEFLSPELWPLPSNQSSLQGHTPLIIESAFLVQDLCQRYHDSEDFLLKLKAIGQNAREGYYATIRELELELIQTGKIYLTSSDFLDQYIPHVRSLCDGFYSQHGTRPRTYYHLLGISLFDRLLPSVSREPQQLQSEYSLISYPDDNYILRDLNGTFGWHTLMMSNTQQQPVSSEGVPDFGPTLDLTALHPAPSGAQMTTGSPNHLLIRSDASETPSDYTVSPAPLSDALLDIPTSSYGPTLSAKVQGEERDTSSLSTLGSSGPKVEASERCEICGYRPKGDPQWFKGSMAKHKKMQHSTNPPIIFKCPFPGCNSEYKNRRDNLRQHQIEKNHFVGDEAAQRRHKRKRKGDV